MFRLPFRFNGVAFALKKMMKFSKIGKKGDRLGDLQTFQLPHFYASRFLTHNFCLSSAEFNIVCGHCALISTKQS